MPGLSLSATPCFCSRSSRLLSPETIEAIIHYEGGTLTYKKPDAHGPDASPFPFLELPFEIRRRIYKLLLRRPIGICPNYNSYHHKEGENAFIYTKYRYQWARSEGVIAKSNPSRDGTETPYFCSWKSSATKEQMTYILENPTAVEVPVTRSKNGLPVYVSGLIGLGLLATNHQINKEAAGVLYGENMFFFDMRYSDPVTMFHEERNLVPSLAFEANRRTITPTEKQIKGTVGKSFNKDANQHKPTCENPLTKFLRTIGTNNAALVKTIICEVKFTPLLSNIWCIETQPYITFDGTLGPLGFILKHSCPSLLSVSLSVMCYGDYTRASTGEIVRVEEDKSYMEDFDMIVGPLVKYLSRLSKLRLAVWSENGGFISTSQKELESGHEIL